MPTRVLATLPRHGPRSAPLRYALALAIVIGATAARLAVDRLVHDQVPYVISTAGVVVATWFGGVGGGILATIVSAFTANYFFVEPRYQWVPHGEDWLAMGLFTPVSLFLVWLVGRWRSAETELRGHHEELRLMHAESERANRLKDEFLSTLSHELRTPLSAVIGWAHMLANTRLSPPQMQHAVGVILRNADLQKRLVEDVLDISRMISGKMPLHLGLVDMEGVVRNALDTIRPAANAKHIEIVASLTPHATLAGDGTRLQQIVWNLLSNGVKFTPKGGRVEVRTIIHESEFVLTVSDTGIGIEPAFLPYVFQRFSQADSSSTRSFGGLGVGLAITRHLVELHGGTIAAESAGAGAGATFTVRLPIRAVVDAVGSVPNGGEHLAAADETRAPSLVGLRLLVVDDEPDARELVHAALSRLGAEVRTAESAAEAFALVRGWRPDVLVADIGMPVEDGYSLIRRIRALAPAEGGGVPAIALTAYAQDEDRKRAHAAGFQEHVSKPVPPADLARIIVRHSRPN